MMEYHAALKKDAVVHWTRQESWCCQVKKLQNSMYKLIPLKKPIKAWKSLEGYTPK